MVHFKERRVTQKDIAQAADLSIAAVSMALKGNRALPQSTINRVKQIADRLGYVPDPALSALAAHRNQTRPRSAFSIVALVNHDIDDEDWKNTPSAQALLTAANERAKELGYNIQSFNTASENLSSNRLSQILHTRGIRGLLLSPSAKVSTDSDLWEKFTAVSILEEQPLSTLHYVATHQNNDMALCWSKLLESGRRRIGLAIDHRIAGENVTQWEAAHFFGRHSHCIPQEDEVPSLKLDETGTSENLRQWLRTYRPEAIITNKPGLWTKLQTLGYSLPNDMAYVSLNTEDDAPHISGIKRESKILGRLAIDSLNALLQRNQSGPNPTSVGSLVNSAWQEGQTL